MYQHDLSQRTFVTDRETLRFDLTYGLMLSFDWVWQRAQLPDSPWLRLVSHLQRAVAARYAGQALISVAPDPDAQDALRSDYGAITLWSNSGANPITIFGHGLAPNDVYARTPDGTVEAGIFTNSYAGHALSAGDHVLLIERGPGVTVRQLLGGDTPLWVRVPAPPLSVRALDAQGALISALPFATDTNGVSFAMSAMLNDRRSSASRSAWPARASICQSCAAAKCGVDCGNKRLVS